MSFVLTSEVNRSLTLSSLHVLISEMQKVVHPGSREHGEKHAREVACVGLWLARQVEGSDPLIVLLFAILHDALRVSDDDDPLHGERAAHLAQALGGVFYHLGEAREAMLCDALRFHCLYPALVTTVPTLACCWDADRLLYTRGAAEIEVEERFLSLRESRESRKQLRDLNLSWQELFEAYSALVHREGLEQLRL